MTCLRSLLVSLVTVVGWVAAQTPKISFISGPDIVTNLGEKVMMECRVENGKEYPINWIKIRRDRGQDYEYMPLSTGKMMVVKDDRIELKYDASSSSYTLSITDIQDFDAAKYQCQVIVGINNKISKEVNLKIRLPAEILNNGTSADDAEEISASSGEKVQIHCPTDGFPKPSVTWTRVDGGLMPDSADTSLQGDYIRISSVRKEDRGVYRCTASNGVGSPVTRDYMLKVGFPPAIRVPRPRIHQAKGYGVSMVCNVEAFPAPAIVWSKNGARIVNDEVHTVVHFYQGSAVTLSTVKISNLFSDFYGTYECEASNRYGADKQKLELIDTNVPIPEAVYGSGAVGKSGAFLLISLLSVLARSG